MRDLAWPRRSGQATVDRLLDTTTIFDAARNFRAAWVEAQSDGTITSMLSPVGVDPISHPELATLAMLVAA